MCSSMSPGCTRTCSGSRTLCCFRIWGRQPWRRAPQWRCWLPPTRSPCSAGNPRRRRSTRRSVPAKAPPPGADKLLRPILNRYATSPFLLLSTHAHVLIAIAEDPDVRQRELAERVGVTERTVQSVITDLVENDYLSRTRVGRRN